MLLAGNEEEWLFAVVSAKVCLLSSLKICVVREEMLLCCRVSFFIYSTVLYSVHRTPYSIGTYPTITNIVYGKAVGQGFLFSCSTNIKPWGRVSFFMFNKHLYGIMPPVRQCVTFSCIINIINGSAAEMQSFYVRVLF